MTGAAHPTLAEVQEQLITAAADFDQFQLWTRPDAVPPRLLAASQRLADAVIDLRSAAELEQELAADKVEGPDGRLEDVRSPLGVLSPDAAEDALPDPHAAPWAAWREFAAAAEKAALASFVRPWPGQPEGWIESADRLLDSVHGLFLQEDSALRFAESGHRPYLVGGPLPEGFDPDPPVPPTPGRRVREFQTEFGAEFAAGLQPLLDDHDQPRPPIGSDLRTPREQELPLGHGSEPPSIAELRATLEQQRVPVATSAPAERTPVPAPSISRHRAPSRG